MKGALYTMKDLAKLLQDEIDSTSIRRVAKRIGIAKTTASNIAKRKLKSMPEVATLEKIAIAYGLTLPAVVEMAGAMLGDGDKFARLARELEQSPWIRKRFDELVGLSEDEFNYALDLIAFRRQRGETPPQSIQ